MRQSKTMLEGSEWKLILLFTLPLMAGNLLQQLYNTVDGIVVGNFVGETALAAVGTCAPLTMLFTAIALGMSNGAAVVISQFYGAGRMDEMKKAVASSLILLFGMGVVLSILGSVLSGWLLRVVLGRTGLSAAPGRGLFPDLCHWIAGAVYLQHCGGNSSIYG